MIKKAVLCILVSLLCLNIFGVNIVKAEEVDGSQPKYIELKLIDSSIKISYVDDKFVYYYENAEENKIEFNPSTDTFVLSGEVSNDKSINIENFGETKTTLNFEFKNLTIHNTVNEWNSSWNHVGSASNVNVNIKLVGNNSISVGYDRPAMQIPATSKYTFTGDKDSSLTLSGGWSFATGSDGKKVGAIEVNGNPTLVDRSPNGGEIEELIDNTTDKNWMGKLDCENLQLGDWLIKKEKDNQVVNLILDKYLGSEENVVIPNEFSDYPSWQVVVNGNVQSLFTPEQRANIETLTIGDGSDNSVKFNVNEKDTTLIYSFANLTKLVINKCEINNVENVSKLINHCDKLNYIDLSGLNDITFSQNLSEDFISFNPDNKYVVISKNDSIKDNIKDKYNPYLLNFIFNLDGGNVDGSEENIEEKIDSKSVYDSVGDLNDTFTFKYEEIESNILKGKKPVKPGYKMVGWTYGENQIDPEYNFFSAFPKDSVELVAKWEPKAVRAITLKEGNDSFVYDGSEVVFTRDHFDINPAIGVDDFAIKWMKGDVELTGNPKDAGEYWVVASLKETDDYSAVVEKFKVTINKADSTLVFKSVDGGKTYDGKPVSTPIVDKKGTSKDVTISWYKSDGTKLAFAPSNAGKYKVVASVEADDNYNGTSIEKEFSIYKANPVVKDVKGLVITQGQALSTVDLPKGYAWENGSVVASELGEHAFKATYTPEDTDNYNVLELDIKVKVVAKPVTTPTPEPTVKPTPEVTPEATVKPTPEAKPQVEAPKAPVYDDGGPFTTDECGSVYDRWGNLMWKAPSCKAQVSDGYSIVNTSDK